MDYYINETNNVNILQTRFNYTKDFDTENGLSIRSQISKWYNTLNLSTKYGCAPITYTVSPISCQNSLFKLYLDEIFPKVVYNSGEICTPYPFLG